MPSDTYTLTISDVGVSTPADGSVTTVKIVDLNVTTGKIADNAITSAKIANNTIVAGDIADGTITSAKILDGTIVAGDIADGTITSAKILDGTIVEGDIANGAITSAKIANSTIVSGDIADSTITLGKIAQIPANTVLGNNTGLTATTATHSCSSFGFSMLAASDAAGVRATLGLGTMATQPSNSVTITGGTISGITLTGTTINVSSVSGVLSTANGGTGVTTSTGTGSTVRSTSPTLVTPTLGTPTSGSILTNCTGLPLTTGVTGTLTVDKGGTGVTTSTGTGSTVRSTSPTLITPVLGIPASGSILTNCTGLPLTTGVTGVLPVDNGGTGATAPSTGTGGIVLSNSPTLVTPVLGTPASGSILTNCTGLPLTTGITGILPIANGGTNSSTGVNLETSLVTGILPISKGGTGSSTSAATISVSGQFTWLTNTTSGPAISVAGMTSSSNVIIQERNTVTPAAKHYSVVCSAGNFVPYASTATGMSGLSFSYIAFL